MARDAPGAPLSSLASSSIIEYFSASPRPRPPDTTTAASSSFGPAALLDVAVLDHWRRWWRRCRAPRWSTTSAAPPPLSSAANDLGRTTKMYGASPVKAALTICVPPKMACSDVGVVAAVEADDVGEHRPVELGRQPAGDVAAVVGHADEKRVGPVAGLDLRGDGGGDGHAGQRLADVADVVDLGDAVLAQLVGVRRRRRRPRPRPRPCRRAAGLGQQLEDDRERLALERLGEDPHLVDAILRSPSAGRGTGRCVRGRRPRPARSRPPCAPRRRRRR